MVAEIATGYLPRDQRRNTQQTQKKRKEETRDPPFRPTVPVVTIVAGGLPAPPFTHCTARTPGAPGTDPVVHWNGGTVQSCDVLI